MTLIQRVLAGMKSAQPGATGQAVVTVTVQESETGSNRTMVFHGTAEEVAKAQSAYFIALAASGRPVR
jgi:hypothetical protein